MLCSTVYISCYTNEWALSHSYLHTSNCTFKEGENTVFTLSSVPALFPACITRSTNLSLLYSKRLKLGDESLGMRLQLPTSFKQTTPGTVFAERV